MNLAGLPLPPGWVATMGDDDRDLGVVFLTNPRSTVVGNMHRTGHFTLLGCSTRRHVDEMLRVMLPFRGVAYPYIEAEQLTLEAIG